MPRKPKPYKKDSYYVTSIGGVPHRKLCEVSKGLKYAELCLARLMVQLDEEGKRPQEKVVDKEAVRVSDVYEDFLSYQQVEASPAHYGWCRDKLDVFFERFATRELASITLADGLAYKKFLMEEKEWTRGKTAHKGLGNSTVNAHIRAAKMLFNWAAKPSRQPKYGLQSNPWQEIKYLTEKPRERLITEEELEALLGECKDGSVSGGAQDFREMIVALRFTTMRPGELRMLRWEYVQWEEHRLVFPPEDIKTRRRREITLIDKVETLLKERHERMGKPLEGYVFPLPGKGLDGKSIAGAGDDLQKANGIAQRFRRLVGRCVAKGLIQKEKIGERICLYLTRHARITELCADGHSLPIVMFEAGHQNASTTQRYLHLAGSLVTEQIRKKSSGKSEQGEASDPG